MSKYINRYLIALVFAISTLLTGCNNTYFKPDKSSSLRKINTRYTEIHKSVFEYAYMNINFTRNGNTAAIFDASEISFYDLNQHRIIKKIQARDWWRLKYGESSKDGKYYLLIIDGFIRILDTQNWQTIAQFKIKNSISNHPNFSDNGTRLYTGNSLWNIATGEHIKESVFSIDQTSSDFSDNNHYFILSDGVYGATLVDMESKKRLETLPVIKYSRQVTFRDNHSFYIDYGAKTSYFTKTLGLFNIEPQAMLAEITPYQAISCWTRLKEDKRLIMGLVDGSLLVLDEKLHVLEHWNIGSKALKCIGGKNARVWLATGVVEPSDPSEKYTSYNLYEVNINQKTISSPVQLEGTIKHLAVSPDGKYIALVNDLPNKTMARIYLNNDL
ncbi:MAG TPA: WD40 repeat domain-containing protein [Gammaproteobacteria bacterium]|nr:WD40 repeat domain-containing protein [Gammaproteobacteria bacterium]